MLYGVCCIALSIVCRLMCDVPRGCCLLCMCFRVVYCVLHVVCFACRSAFVARCFIQGVVCCFGVLLSVVCCLLCCAWYV